MHPTGHCSTTYSSPNTAATKMPISRGLDRDGVVYIYTMECYLDIKKINNAICYNTDGPRDSHTSEVTQRKANIMRSILWANNDTREFIQKTETDSKISKPNLQLLNGKCGEGWTGCLVLACTHCYIGNRLVTRTTIQNGEIYSILCDGLYGERI